MIHLFFHNNNNDTNKSAFFHCGFVCS